VRLVDGLLLLLVDDAIIVGVRVLGRLLSLPLLQGRASNKLHQLWPSARRDATTYHSIINLKLVPRRLSRRILFVIRVETRIEQNGRREPSHDRVIVRFLRLVVEIVLTERLGAVGDDDRYPDLLLFVVDQFAEPYGERRLISTSSGRSRSSEDEQMAAKASSFLPRGPRVGPPP
jgi:hypothetical protein